VNFQIYRNVVHVIARLYLCHPITEPNHIHTCSMPQFKPNCTENAISDDLELWKSYPPPSYVRISSSKRLQLFAITTIQVNIYMLFTGCEVRTEKIFSLGLRSGPKPKAEGRFWGRGKIFFSTDRPKRWIKCLLFYLIVHGYNEIPLKFQLRSTFEISCVCYFKL
jgi:hypothetical protein